MGDRCKPVAIPLAPASTRLVASGRGRVRRLSVRETSGAATAQFELYDGNSTDGTLIGSYNLGIGLSIEQTYRAESYPFESSLYLNVLAGAFEGAIVVQYHGPTDMDEEPVVILGAPTTVVDLSSLVTASEGVQSSGASAPTPAFVATPTGP